MWALIIIAALGILLAIVIKKIIGKIITLVIAAVLVFFCWQQRDRVVNAADDLKAQVCSGSEDLPSFFGIEVSAPEDWCTTE